jgi:hypothetical protein
MLRRAFYKPADYVRCLIKAVSVDVEIDEGGKFVQHQLRSTDVFRSLHIQHPH